MLILLGLIGIVSCLFSPLPPLSEMKEAVLFSQLSLSLKKHTEWFEGVLFSHGTVPCFCSLSSVTVSNYSSSPQSQSPLLTPGERESGFADLLFCTFVEISFVLCVIF